MECLERTMKEPATVHSTKPLSNQITGEATVGDLMLVETYTHKETTIIVCGCMCRTHHRNTDKALN